jgi:hypothetical protein
MSLRLPEKGFALAPWAGAFLLPGVAEEKHIKTVVTFLSKILDGAWRRGKGYPCQGILDESAIE